MTSNQETNTGHSVLVHKATRGPRIVKTDLPLEAAVREASAMYDASKVFAGAGLLPSGVAVLVATDDEAQRMIATRRIPLDQKIVLFQAGPY